MRPRALTFLMVLCLVMLFLSAVVSGTDRKEPDGKRARHISEDVYPSEKARLPSADKYRTTVARDESDCYNLIPDPEVPAVTEHDLVGSTWYEFQQVGSMGRMISATSAALGGYRHVSWMWTAGVYPGTQRRVYARSKPEAGVWSTVQEVGLGTVNSGFSNQTHLNDGTSAVFFHRTGIGGYWCYLGVADAPAADPLYTRKWDLPDNIVEASSGEVGAWPKGAVLYTYDPDVYPNHPLNFLHIVESEWYIEWYYDSIGTENREKEIAYLRCYIDPTELNNLICQTPNEPLYNITANWAFQDEVHSFDNSCHTSAVPVTGMGIVGQKVAVVHMPPAVPGDCDYFGDVGYIECLDNGGAWIDGTDWPPAVHKITTFGISGGERAINDLSACYDYEDSLHIVYVTCGFDPAQPGYYFPEVARLYHWSKQQGRSLIARKIQEGANPGANNANLSKPSISPKDPVYHPGGDSSYLFCIWTQVDSSDRSAAGFGNGDLYGSVTVDGGSTWGKVLNLTGTHTPGCAAGNCVSEHWPSLATNMLDGDLHIEYICDRDAGGAIVGEGEWTESYVMYMRLPEWEFSPQPYSPPDCERSFHDPCMVTCPLGDIPFRVYLKDSEGAPVANYSNVWLDFSDCSGLVACGQETDWPIVHPDGPSDENGVVTFTPQAGGCDNYCEVEVRIQECGLLGYVPVKTVDVDGDLMVEVKDWHHYGVDMCNDYNCNGQVNELDLEFFRDHVFHPCVPDPCLMVIDDLVVSPDTLLPEDSTHHVQLFIQNRYTESCEAQYVEFYRAGFGQGPTLYKFATVYLWQMLAPGDSATAETDFVVPGPGSGYILSKLYTSCCERSIDATWTGIHEICPPDSMTYIFPLQLDVAPAYVETLEYLPDTLGWYWFMFESGGMPDSVAIVTPDTSVLGVTGGVTLYFFDGSSSLYAYRICEVRITLNSGDVNSDCVVNVGDIVYLVNFLYKGDDPPDPWRAGDVNCDCLPDVGDVVYLVNYLYKSGPPPVSSETCECQYKHWFPRW